MVVLVLVDCKICIPSFLHVCLSSSAHPYFISLPLFLVSPPFALLSAFTVYLLHNAYHLSHRSTIRTPLLLLSSLARSPSASTLLFIRVVRSACLMLRGVLSIKKIRQRVKCTGSGGKLHYYVDRSGKVTAPCMKSGMICPCIRSQCTCAVESVVAVWAK